MLIERLPVPIAVEALLPKGLVEYPGFEFIFESSQCPQQQLDIVAGHSTCSLAAATEILLLPYLVLVLLMKKFFVC
jgi:hypothetical protein